MSKADTPSPHDLLENFLNVVCTLKVRYLGVAQLVEPLTVVEHVIKWSLVRFQVARKFWVGAVSHSQPPCYVVVFGRRKRRDFNLYYSTVHTQNN